jgi:hypothetical protein
VKPFVALAAALMVGGCASVAEALGRASCDIGAQVCSHAFEGLLCGDDGNDDDALSDQSDTDDPDTWRARADAKLAEAPPPEWRAEPGRAPCSTQQVDDRIEVSCADGTRASFLNAAQSEPTWLVSEQPAHAADGCVGVARKQGVDRDGDGALAPAEMWGRTVVCHHESEVLSPTVLGDLLLRTPADVVLLAGRRAVTGGVTVASPTLSSLVMPQLRSIGGSLRVLQSPVLRRIELSHLASIGDDLSITNVPALEHVALPQLDRLGGALVATDNAHLPQRDVERWVGRLSRRGFAGSVVTGGNTP